MEYPVLSYAQKDEDTVVNRELTELIEDCRDQAHLETNTCFVQSIQITKIKDHSIQALTLCSFPPSKKVNPCAVRCWPQSACKWTKEKLKLPEQYPEQYALKVSRRSWQRAKDSHFLGEDTQLAALQPSVTVFCMRSQPQCQDKSCSPRC